MYSVVKYFYNSPHVFTVKCRQIIPNERQIFVRPKTGCVQAKIGLNGRLNWRQPGNYFKPCLIYYGCGRKVFNNCSKDFCLP